MTVTAKKWNLLYGWILSCVVTVSADWTGPEHLFVEELPAGEDGPGGEE